ncbi:MAG: tetratricopeptide repeat protein [Nitrospirae bacterium]|nr:tetratricopeptide repeat protein [Nitrospirota bacterium]
MAVGDYDPREEFMVKIAKVFFVFLTVALTCGRASSAPVFIEKEYSYQASELDSRISSRTIALEQVKRLALEQVGTYVASTTIVNDYQLSSDQITAITAGIVGVEIEKESWDGKTYYIKARCTVDPEEVSQAIGKVLQDQNQLAELEDTKAKMDDLLKEVDDLKSQVAYLETPNQQGQNQDRPQGQYGEQPQSQYEGQPQGSQYQNQYTYVINQVRTLALVQSSWTYYNAGQYQSALIVLNKAALINPGQEPRIHVARSFVYFRMNDRTRSLAELTMAARLDPRYRRQVALNRTVYFQRTGDRNRALAEANRTVSQYPGYSYAYYHRAMIHNDMGNRNRADQDMRRAAQLGNKKAQYYLRTRPPKKVPVKKPARG